MAASNTPSTGRPDSQLSSEPPEIEVEFSDTQAHLRVDHASLRELVGRALRLEGRNRASISIAIVDDDTIRRINRAHLGHDWPTDVITFPLSEQDEAILLGELVVSAEMACGFAREHSLDAAGELELYVVHGILHLCGYDDRDEAAAAAMRNRECAVLAAARIPSRSG
jgi:probable rRNA maturation factor